MRKQIGNWKIVLRKSESNIENQEKILKADLKVQNQENKSRFESGQSGKQSRFETGKSGEQ